MTLEDLSNVDIDKFFEGVKEYGGCFSKDESAKMQDGKFYVLNLDGKNKSGSHWVGCFLLGKCGIYYDSYGCPPPQQTLKRMKEIKKVNVMNLSDYQALGTNLCGYYVLFVLSNLYKKKPLSDILDVLDQNDQAGNDVKITKWWKTQKVI